MIIKMTTTPNNNNELTVKNENNEKKENNENNNNNNNNKSNAGVIYLSKIPTKMNVKLIREYFSEYGQLDRIYLQPKETKRKNKVIRTFTEGWVEFKNKKIAKKVANRLNNKQVGGKRRNPWYEELWNIKYLKNFRWTHINERMAYENEVRKQRLRQEVVLAKKQANFYKENIEKSEKLKRLEKKLKQKNEININLQKKLQDESDEDNNETKNKLNENNTDSNDDHKNKSNNVDNKNNVSDDDDDDDNEFQYKNKRPKFERKIKVTNNDAFLKQIFSK